VLSEVAGRRVDGLERELLQGSDRWMTHRGKLTSLILLFGYKHFYFLLRYPQLWPVLEQEVKAKSVSEIDPLELGQQA
jgi:hypothetical protein